MGEVPRTWRSKTIAVRAVRKISGLPGCGKETAWASFWMHPRTVTVLQGKHMLEDLVTAKRRKKGVRHLLWILRTLHIGVC